MNCHICGRFIKDGEEKLDYYDRPICQEHLQGDSKNCVCPHCEKLVPVEHMWGNFCDKCAPNND